MEVPVEAMPATAALTTTAALTGTVPLTATAGLTSTVPITTSVPLTPTLAPTDAPTAAPGDAHAGADCDADARTHGNADIGAHRNGHGCVRAARRAGDVQGEVRRYAVDHRSPIQDHLGSPGTGERPEQQVRAARRAGVEDTGGRVRRRACAGSPRRTDEIQGQSGDNLSSIATKFGITWEELARANGLTSKSVLRIGQELTIPVAGSAVAPPATQAPSATTVAQAAATATPVPPPPRPTCPRRC